MPSLVLHAPARGSAIFGLRSVWISTSRREVDLRLPKWDFGTRLDLKEPLPRLGVTLPFDIDRADLTRISGESLYVGRRCTPPASPSTNSAPRPRLPRIF